VHASQSWSAKETETAVLNAIQTFVGSAPQFDDITLMILRREGQAVGD